MWKLDWTRNKKTEGFQDRLLDAGLTPSEIHYLQNGNFASYSPSSYPSSDSAAPSSDSAPSSSDSAPASYSGSPSPKNPSLPIVNNDGNIPVVLPRPAPAGRPSPTPSPAFARPPTPTPQPAPAGYDKSKGAPCNSKSDCKPGNACIKTNSDGSINVLNSSYINKRGVCTNYTAELKALEMAKEAADKEAADKNRPSPPPPPTPSGQTCGCSATTYGEIGTNTCAGGGSCLVGFDRGNWMYGLNRMAFLDNNLEGQKQCIQGANRCGFYPCSTPCGVGNNAVDYTKPQGVGPNLMYEFPHGVPGGSPDIFQITPDLVNTEERRAFDDVITRFSITNASSLFNNYTKYVNEYVTSNSAAWQSGSTVHPELLCGTVDAVRDTAIGRFPNNLKINDIGSSLPSWIQGWASKLSIDLNSYIIKPLSGGLEIFDAYGTDHCGFPYTSHVIPGVAPFN